MRALLVVLGFIAGWALVEIFKDATYIKNESKLIDPEEQMLFFQVGYLMGANANAKGYRLDSTWVIDSTIVYDKFLKPKKQKI